MKRMASLLAAPATLLALGVGVAIAASSPTVSTGPATSVTDTSAKLAATINPNGADTGYVIQYGLTSSYGLSSTSRSAGSATKPVSVATTIKGLTPGTVYHYRVSALNKAGAASGADRKFKTTGAPPAAVVTGAPSSVLKTQATLTGTIDPEGAGTQWVIQYGLTAAYAVQSFPQTLPAVTGSVPVSLQLSGLAPATLFHYRVVAYHGANVVSAGADATFFTQPDRRPVPRLTARTQPAVARKSPYSFTTDGTLHGAAFIPASARCSGTVALRYYQGRKQVGVAVAPVGSDCRFTAQDTFHRRLGHGPTRLRITIHFRGNGYLAAADRTNSVTAG